MVRFIPWDFFAITISLINGLGIIFVFLFVVFYQLNRDFKVRQLRKLRQRFRRFWCELIRGDLRSRDINRFSADDLILLLPFFLKRKNHPDFKILVECFRATGIVNNLLARLNTAKMKDKWFYLDLLSYLNYEHADQLLAELLRAAPTAPLAHYIQEPQTADGLTFKNDGSNRDDITKLNDDVPQFHRCHLPLNITMKTMQFKTAARPKFYNIQFSGTLQLQTRYEDNFSTVNFTDKCSNDGTSDVKSPAVLFDDQVGGYHRSGKDYAFIFD